MKNAVAVVLVLLAVGLAARRIAPALRGEPVPGLLGPERLDHPWPPVKGQPYPDLELPDASGKPVKLSSLRGKVLLIEPIGLACAGCNAFAGGEELGGFRGATVQEGVGSIEDLLRRYASVRLEDEPDLVLVQLLLFDDRSQVGHAPTAEDARAWARHFRLEGAPNVIVLRGSTALANPASFGMVPGFQLVDRQGVLRYDGSGHHPQDPPYDTVLAAVPDLLREGQ